MTSVLVDTVSHSSKTFCAFAHTPAHFTKIARRNSTQVSRWSEAWRWGRLTSWSLRERENGLYSVLHLAIALVGIIKSLSFQPDKAGIYELALAGIIKLVPLGHCHSNLKEQATNLPFVVWCIWLLTLSRKACKIGPGTNNFTIFTHTVCALLRC